MKSLFSVSIGLAVLALTAPPASADVKLTMGNGRVTLVAKDATLRQILTEWARVGQTKIINLERIPGGPVSMELTNMPEAEALDVLLRSVAGYLAAPRPVDMANLSHFDRIVVMPTSAAPRPTVASQTQRQPPPPPAFVQPAAPPPAPPEDGEEDRPVAIAPPGMANGGPVFNPQQQPQIVTPGSNGAQPAAPAANPPSTPFPRAAPAGGVAVPGMIVPSQQPAPGAQPAAITPGGAGSNVE